MTKHPESRKIEDQDTELIRSINSGQSLLFHELVKRYEQRLYNFGLKMCGDVQDAEDMVQDTFLNIFRYLKDFRYETKFKNWMYRIATSTCIKKRRKSKYAPDTELSLEEFLPRDESEIKKELPQWAAQPLDKLLNAELSSNLKSAIIDLPEKYRVVFVLRDMEGFSTAETADILNLTPANIKVRLHRARLFLKEQLQKYFEDE